MPTKNELKKAESNLPPFLLKVKQTDKKEFKRLIKILKLGLDRKTWDTLKDAYDLS